jgi:dUTP pyrophosphatase
MSIIIERINKNAVLPRYQRDGDAGMDFVANNFKQEYYVDYYLDPETDTHIKYEVSENIDEDIDEYILKPSSRVLIGTGLKMQMPKNYELQIRPRSGLALSDGITVINSPGTIDSNYRGEIGVILINHGGVPVSIKKGDRVAQGVFSQFIEVNPIEGAINDSNRGSNGFGSSGK